MKNKLVWLLILGCLFVPAFPDPPLRTGPYVQNVTAGSAVVAVVEAAPRVLALRLATAAGEVVRELPRSEARRRHAFVLEGLSPGTAYRFELLDEGGALAGDGGFSTAPARDDAPVTFAVVGDSGGLPWWIWLQNGPLFHAVARLDLLPVRSITARIGELLAAAGPDLWFHVGDVVYPRGQYRHYRAGFFRPFEAALRRAPCYPVLGNHDLVDDDGRQLLRNFELPTNEVTGDERFFSVSWGAVRFLGLDLTRPLKPGDACLEFLDEDLRDAAEPWRIVFAHHPPFSASRQGDRRDLIEHLVPRLRAHEVDLMFVGHDHNYQRFAAAGDPVLVVTGGGGKSLYELEDDARVAAAVREYHFCRVRVDGPALRIEAIGQGGRPIDVFEMDLAAQAAARPRFDPEHRARDRRIRALLEAR